ncbi:MAG: SDR family oxidoreductase [Myxococcota bacterium]|nr:SDR family oxidoreductase [Myxococcales bacterium]
MADPSISRLFDLTGTTALVIGASSGIGARAADVLARAGADVAVAARRREQLEAVAAGLRGHGRKACAFVLDAGERGASERCVAEVEATLGGVSLLVYASGVSRLGRAERHSPEKWDQALAVNLTGAFEASQAVGRRLIERGEPGSIVHVGSVASLGANSVHRSVGYAASKAGLANLTRQLAIEWAPHGIRVNLLAPGYFATDFTIDPRVGDIAPDQKAEIERLTPLGRVGRLEELDTALAFLTSPASSYVTGTILTVDGGWTAW